MPLISCAVELPSLIVRNRRTVYNECRRSIRLQVTWTSRSGFLCRQRDNAHLMTKVKGNNVPREDFCFHDSRPLLSLHTHVNPFQDHHATLPLNLNKVCFYDTPPIYRVWSLHVKRRKQSFFLLPYGLNDL